MNLRSVVLIIVLGLGVLGFVAPQSTAQAALSSESGQCPADSSAHAQPAGAHRHCVKLTWRASVPASKLSRDAVTGYNVYRSETPHDPEAKQINTKIITGTTYTDTDVKLGTVYFYVVRGLSKMAKSDPSNEARAEIPPQ
ncbi:MAG: fibronectin type III domain-containing protein [Terriglobales bacterium]